LGWEQNVDPQIMNLVQVLHIFFTSKTRTLGYNDTISLGTNPVIPSRQINRVLSWLCRLSKKSFVRFVVSLGSFTGLKSSLRSLKLVRLTCSKSTGFPQHSRTLDFLNKDRFFKTTMRGTLMQENKVVQSTISAYMWEFFRFILYLVKLETWGEKTGCSCRLDFTMHSVTTVSKISLFVSCPNSAFLT